MTCRDSHARSCGCKLCLRHTTNCHTAGFPLRFPTGCLPGFLAQAMRASVLKRSSSLAPQLQKKVLPVAEGGSGAKVALGNLQVRALGGGRSGNEQLALPLTWRSCACA